MRRFKARRVKLLDAEITLNLPGDVRRWWGRSPVRDTVRHDGKVPGIVRRVPQMITSTTQKNFGQNVSPPVLRRSRSVSTSRRIR